MTKQDELLRRMQLSFQHILLICEKTDQMMKEYWQQSNSDNHQGTIHTERDA